MDDLEQFRQLALPLMQWLCENHHPHVTVIITPSSAQLMEGMVAFHDESFIRD